jgi:ligand-binding sensor domain-containing protein/signal transduction histidine kinase
MIANRQNTAWGFRLMSRILPLCIMASYAIAAQPGPSTGFADSTAKAGVRGDRDGTPDSPLRESQNFDTQAGHALLRDLKFAHLTTNDGLSQSSVTEMLQDRRGFMWFATRDGLNRYDGNAFIVYKHNPNDPGSLSANFVLDLMEDDQGYLWIATDFGGVNKFDPATERFVRYRHDPNNPNSISGDSVETIARDSRGHLWFGTVDSGLDKFDPRTGAFTHYLNDSDSQFVGRITKVIAGRQGDIWFVGERGLFHLNPETGQITRPPATVTNGLAADYVYEDDAGNLWMLAWSPIVGLVKYDRRAERLTKYPLGAGAVGVASSNLLADGQNGFWVPSSQGLYYFDRRTERFTYRLQHDETNPNSLDDNTVVAIYQDKGGLLWAGTGSGLNLLNSRQEQFGQYRHLPNSTNSLSPGKVTAIYEEPNNILWVGFLPRALDRLDRKTGQLSHYVPGRESKNALSEGMNVAGIYKDAHGYLWFGGWGAGLDRFDERTGLFKHYRRNPDDPNSLLSDSVFNIYGDRNGHIWVGQLYGLSRLDPATEQFTNYRPDPRNPTWNGSSVSGIHQDRAGTLWVGTTGGALIRVDDKRGTLVKYAPDSRDPQRLNGGGITTIHEDRAGTLWVGAWDGLYRYNRQNGTFTRYTENQGLPSSAIMGILEDKVGRLWLSTKHGISRFDPRTETFRNYDVSDGLQGDEFSAGACIQGFDGEMFFGGSNGFNAFFPENIRDNPYVPPVVITSFKIFNKAVPIGARSVLTKAISYIDGLTLSYRDSVFSFEFAALSYANSRKNRYRYKLENFEPGWNEVESEQRLATYTNLDPGKYVFRVQGSNSDGVWNEEGVLLPIVITPPWWRTNWFRALSAVMFLALLWAAYQFRLRELQHAFNLRLEERLNERTRISRDLHDTLLQSFQGLIPVFQTARNLLPGQSDRAAEVLDEGLHDAAEAIVEGRNAIQNLRAKPSLDPDLGSLLNAIGQELAQSPEAEGSAPAFRVVVEGARQPLTPLLQDEFYRIGREMLRNAFRHAHASRIEAEIRYDSGTFRLRVRDDGKGIESSVLNQGARRDHWGLPGMYERAKQLGGRLKIWSEPGAGTEAELTVPARIAYESSTRKGWWARLGRRLRLTAPKGEA